MVNVHWGRERFTFPLPPPDTPLKAIRDAITNMTGLTDFKLVHKGAVMKNPESPISAYFIKDHSTIAVVEIHAPTEPKPPPPPLAPVVRSEQSVITAIHSEIAAPQPKEHLRLSELLLQALLRLDGIAVGEWEEARKERKVAVKEVQTLLDRLDSGRS
uniref:BAG domain-containing protein n=1 Tax=Mycena chlorophos TaxID=658473 RepID=A0ABQ0LYU4_MYCCL|nr:predicted protein [Mycena chlorophos]